MRTILIHLPETVDLTPKEAVMVLAAQLYQMGKLSLGQAADLAGYSKRTFMELLGNYGVSVFNYPVDDLDHDVLNAKNYSS